MPYTKNPHMPKVRMEAVKLHRQGWSARKIGRYLGFHHTAIMKWVRIAPADARMVVPTKSSRPKSHPKALDDKLVKAIIAQRRKHGRCAEVVHKELLNQGLKVSLSSVKRTLDRHFMLKKRSPWKRLHTPIPRPEVQNPGDLVQIDTIHIFLSRKERFYIYTMLDVYSRWSYARVGRKINTYESLKFMKEAIKKAPFKIKVLQSDHGSEFSTYFTENIQTQGLVHRHSRVRRPNDNGHLERFNRTIQEEALNKAPKHPIAYQIAINNYLPYYNNERLHLGINLKTPIQWCQAID